MGVGSHPRGPQGPQSQDSAAARAAGLIAVAEDLAGEFSLRPLLERILLRCTELLGCHAGSICSVDEASATYRKEADIGVACQSGQVFPLTEGMTGAVVARRAPVWFARYDDVPGGHVAPEERASLRGVIGVPLEWRGRIIGACIVFSRDEHRTFGPDDAELLELFAKHAAIALANARMHEAAEERARTEAAAAERDRLLGELHNTLAQRLASVQVHLDSARRDLGVSQAGHTVGAATNYPHGALADHLDLASAATRDALVEARQSLLGLSAPPDGLALEAALGSEAAWAESIGGLEVRLVTAGSPVAIDGRLSREVLWAAREALTNIVRHAQARTVRIGLLYEPASVSLLVQDDGQGFDLHHSGRGDQFGLRAMSERARELGATVDIDSLPGWGTRIRARFPYLTSGERGGPRLRVLVAARRPVLRAGLARLLTWTEPGTEVIAEVGAADQALAACRAQQPDVALVDLSLPASADEHEPADSERPAATGDDAVGVLLRNLPGLAVVGLCESGDDEQVADAMRAGARGCVDIGAGGPELAQAVVAAGRGQAILSGAVLSQLHRGMRADDSQPALTEREREVRGLMELGVPDRAIAQRLVLSVKTVEKHAAAVLRKTGVRNRTELAALAGRARHR